MSETPLGELAGWSGDHVARMAEVGITNVEQVVAVSATAGGLQSIAEQLDVSVEEARRLVDLARADLPAALRAELDRRADTRELGLGAMPPEPDDGSGA